MSKSSIAVLLLSICLSLIVFESYAPKPNFSEQFQLWKISFGKHYQSQIQQIYRRKVFMKNYEEIQAHNSLNKSYKKGINQFTDLTQQQFISKHLLSEVRNHQKIISNTQIKPIQDEPEVNWVQKGFVTEVSDQGACGACWAFAALGSVQFLYKKQKGTLTMLSAQQLLDCSGSYGNSGCNQFQQPSYTLNIKIYLQP